MPHTPGPWAAKDWRVCAGLGKGQRISVICDTAANNKSRTPENEANARLIAAAPDLLAACRMVLDDPGLSVCANDVIRAAITKAIN